MEPEINNIPVETPPQTDGSTVVRMPDGRLVRIPNNVDKETVKQVMIKKYPEWAKEKGYITEPEQKTFVDPFSGETRVKPEYITDKISNYLHSDQSIVPDTTVWGFNPVKAIEFGVKSGARLVEALGQGVSSGIGNLAVTGGIVTDATGLTDNAAESVQKRMVDTGVISKPAEDQTFVEGMARLVGEALPGALTGSKIATAGVNAVIQSQRVIPMAIKALGIMTGANAGAALSMNPDEQTILTGDNAFFRIIPGFTVDETGNFSEDLMNKKLNLVIDNMVMGGMADAAIGTVVALWKNIAGPMAKNLYTYTSKEAQKKSVVNNFLHAIADVDLGDSPQAVQKKIGAAIDNLMNSKEFQIELSQIDSELPDIVQKKPTIMTIVDMFEQNAQKFPEGSAERTRLETLIQGFRNKALSHMGPNLEQGLNDAVSMSGRGTQQIVDTVGGGATNINKTMQSGVTDIAQNEVEPILNKMSQRETQKLNILNQIKDAVLNDPLFKDAAGPVVDVRGGKLVGKAQEIFDKLMSAGRKVVDKKRALFEAIPDNTVGDAAIVEKAMDGLKISDTLVQKINNAKGNFKQYDKIILEELNPLISGAYNSGDHMLGGQLYKLKKAMSKEQLDLIADRDGLEAIKAARDFFTNEMTRWYDNPILSEVLDANELSVKGFHYPSVKGRQKLVSGIEQSAELGGKGAREYLDDTIQELNTFMPSAGNKGTYNKDFEDFATLKILDYLKAEITDQGKEINPEVLASLSQQVRDLSGLFSKQRLDSFEELLTKARNGILDVKKIDEQLATLSVSKTKTLEKMYDDILKDFFHSEGIPKENQIRSMYEFFTKSGNEYQLTEILKRAEDKPEVLKALKGGFAQTLKDHLLGVNPSRGNIEKFLELGSKGEAKNSLGRYAEKLFGQDGYKILRDLVKGTQDVLTLTQGRQQLQLNPGDMQKFAIKAANGLMTWLFGVLNPTAARIRTITSEYFGSHDITPYIKEIIDEVLTDPDEFIRLAKKIQAEGISTLTPEMKREIVRSLRIGTMYGTWGSDETKMLNEMEQTRNSKLRSELDSIGLSGTGTGGGSF